eukprot:361186-Chlamydomonas_euryale.AAC.10
MEDVANVHCPLARRVPVPTALHQALCRAPPVAHGVRRLQLPLPRTSAVGLCKLPSKCSLTRPSQNVSLAPLTPPPSPLPPPRMRLRNSASAATGLRASASSSEQRRSGAAAHVNRASSMSSQNCAATSELLTGLASGTCSDGRLLRAPGQCV